MLKKVYSVLKEHSKKVIEAKKGKDLIPPIPVSECDMDYKNPNHAEAIITIRRAEKERLRWNRKFDVPRINLKPDDGSKRCVLRKDKQGRLKMVLEEVEFVKRSSGKIDPKKVKYVTAKELENVIRGKGGRRLNPNIPKNSTKRRNRTGAISTDLRGLREIKREVLHSPTTVKVNLIPAKLNLNKIRELGTLFVAQAIEANFPADETMNVPTIGEVGVLSMAKLGLENMFLQGANDKVNTFTVMFEWMHAIYASLKSTIRDNKAFRFDAPESLFGSDGVYPTGIPDMVQFGTSTHWISGPYNSTTGTFPQGSIGTPLNDEIVEKYGNAGLSRALQYLQSAGYPLIHIDDFAAKDKYEESADAFSMYQQLGGRNYITQCSNEVTPEIYWIFDLGLAQFDSKRDAPHVRKGFGSALARMGMRNDLAYHCDEGIADKVLLKHIDVEEFINTCLYMLVRADFYNSPPLITGTGLTLGAKSVIPTMTRFDFLNYCWFCLKRRINWSYMGGNVSSSAAYNSFGSDPRVTVAVEEESALLFGNLVEFFRSVDPVCARKANHLEWEYVTLIYKGEALINSLLQTVQKVYPLVTSLTGGFATEDWSYAGPGSISGFYTGPRTLQCFFKVSKALGALQQNVPMENYNSEMNARGATLLFYTVIEETAKEDSGATGVVMTQIQNRFKISMNNKGFDLSMIMPKVVIPDETESLTFSVSVLQTLLNESFVLRSCSPAVEGYGDYCIRNSDQFIGPNNTSLDTENKTDVIVLIRQHLGGGLASFFASKTGLVHKLKEQLGKIARGISNAMPSFLEGYRDK
jgi:hypothetical protein